MQLFYIHLAWTFVQQILYSNTFKYENNKYVIRFELNILCGAVYEYNNIYLWEYYVFWLKFSFLTETSEIWNTEIYRTHVERHYDPDLYSGLRQPESLA